MTIGVIRDNAACRASNAGNVAGSKVHGPFQWSAATRTSTWNRARRQCQPPGASAGTQADRAVAFEQSYQLLGHQLAVVGAVGA